jgi:hypothetical protein
MGGLVSAVQALWHGPRTIRVPIYSETQSPMATMENPHPPTPSPIKGEGEPELQAQSLAPSPLVGEGWGEG